MLRDGPRPIVAGALFREFANREGFVFQGPGDAVSVDFGETAPSITVLLRGFLKQLMTCDAVLNPGGHAGCLPDMGRCHATRHVFS